MAVSSWIAHYPPVHACFSLPSRCWRLAILSACGSIQSIPEHLMRALPQGTVHCNARVSELLVEDQQVRGVRMTNGETIEAEQVIIATSSPVAQKFVKKALPTQGVSTVCLYFAGDERLYAERKICSIRNRMHISITRPA